MNEPTPKGDFSKLTDALLSFKQEAVDRTGSNTKLVLVRNVLRDMKRQIENTLALLELETTEELTAARHGLPVATHDAATGQRVIEGVFDGANMVGADGEKYHVPPNYASKSKLVEGDMLKLTISSTGAFIFKQIGPIERNRVVGELMRDDETNLWSVVGEGKKWNVLTASVTFFHGEPGDEAVILIPKTTPSKWAAVENIVKRAPEIV